MHQYFKRSSSSGQRIRKARCPACRSRNASVIGKDGQDNPRAGCLECGHFFVVDHPEKGSVEKGFGVVSSVAHAQDIWLVRLAVAVVIVAVLALVVGIRIGVSRGEKRQPAGLAAQVANVDSPLEPEISAAIVEEVSAAENALSNEDHAMRKALGLFLGASSWADRLKAVRHPEITGARMAEHYRDHNDGAFADLVVSTKITRVGSLVVFTLEGNGLPSTKLVMEERNGKYLVDWESFVLWQEKPWREIHRMSKDKTCEIRCLARPLPNNHPAYRTDDGWMAFELIDPGTKEILYGYLERRDDVVKPDPVAVMQGGALGPVTLSVSPMSGTESQDQVIISDVLALGWVHPLPAGHRASQK